MNNTAPTITNRPGWAGNFAAATLVLMTCMTCGPLTSSAQDKKPSVSVNAFSVKNFVVGRGIKIDQAFGQKYNRPVRAPFRFIVPVDKDKFRVGAQPAPNPGSAYIRVTFATLGEPPQFMENLQFVHFEIGLNDSKTGQALTLDQRMRLGADLLRKQGFGGIVRNKSNAKVLNVRPIQLAKLDAVEVIGSYTDPQQGLVYARLVGFVRSDSPEGIAGVSLIAARHFAIKGPDDFTQATQTGRLLTTFKFINP